MQCGVKVKVASQLGGAMCGQMPQPNALSTTTVFPKGMSVKAVTKMWPFLAQAPKLVGTLLVFVEIQVLVLRAIGMLTKEKQ